MGLRRRDVRVGARGLSREGRAGRRRPHLFWNKLRGWSNASQRYRVDDRSTLLGSAPLDGLCDLTSPKLLLGRPPIVRRTIQPQILDVIFAARRPRLDVVKLQKAAAPTALPIRSDERATNAISRHHRATYAPRKMRTLASSLTWSAMHRTQTIRRSARAFGPFTLRSRGLRSRVTSHRVRIISRRFTHSIARRPRVR